MREFRKINQNTDEDDRRDQRLCYLIITDLIIDLESQLEDWKEIVDGALFDGAMRCVTEWRGFRCSL